MCDPEWASEEEAREEWRARTFPGPSPLPQEEAYEYEMEIVDTFVRRPPLSNLTDDEAGD